MTELAVMISFAPWSSYSLPVGCRLANRLPVLGVQGGPGGLMSLTLSLCAPKDSREANQLFGATCAPFSLAAAVSREGCDVRAALPTLAEKQFTNLPMTAQAIRSLGILFHRTTIWSQYGLALICGSERYHARHWLAVYRDFVHEVSLESWQPMQFLGDRLIFGQSNGQIQSNQFKKFLPVPDDFAPPPVQIIPGFARGLSPIAGNVRRVGLHGSPQ